MECVKEDTGVTAKLGEVSFIGRIKSEGLSYTTCKTIQETVKGNFKVYYK